MNWLDYEAKRLKVKVMVRPVWSEKALGHLGLSLVSPPDNISARPRSDSKIFFSLARGEISLAFLA